MIKATASATDWRHRLVRPAVDYIARRLARLHVSANMLTLIGFFIVVCSAGLILIRQELWAGIVMAAGSLVDSVDGAVARLNGKAGKFGAMLDSALDRLSEGVVLVALVYVYALENQPVVAVVACTALLFSFLVSYVRARAEGLGISCSEGWFTRVERVILLAIGLVTGYVTIALALVAGLSIFTFLQRLYVVWRKA